MSPSRALRLSGRSWVLGGIAVALLIVVAAWIVVLSPVRSEAGQLRSDAASVDTQNVALMAQNNKLRDLAKHKKQLVVELQAALNGLPSGPGLPVFSRQLASQAAARGVTLTGVSIGTPSATTATDAAADPTGSTSAPVASAAQPLAIPVTVTSTGTALQQLLFLRDVQKVGPRLALVTSAAFSPSNGGAEDGSIVDASTLTLQLTVFTNPLPQATRRQLAKLTNVVSAS